MTDHDQVGRTTRSRGTVLTPEACAIAGFTFAVLTMTSQGAWTGLVQALFGGSLAAGRVGSVFASVFMATLLLDAVALWLARRALADPSAAWSWAGHLARATVVVAAVAAAVATLSLVVTLLGLS
jgi:hypothetical protein